MEGLLGGGQPQPNMNQGGDDSAADQDYSVSAAAPNPAPSRTVSGALKHFPIIPPASAFFLSDLAILSGWALLASLLASDEFGWVWRLAPSSVLIGVLVLMLAATLFVFTAMVMRRIAPGWFALTADSHGLRWRDPYFLLFHRQALWVDVDRFHVADDYGPFGTVRMFRENSSISLSNRPSAFDAPLPSNYGMSPRALAALLEQCRRAAPAPSQGAA